MVSLTQKQMSPRDSSCNFTPDYQFSKLWHLTQGQKQRSKLNYQAYFQVVLCNATHLTSCRVNSRTTSRITMCGTSSESQRNGDCKRVIFILIWPWLRVKIRGQSSTVDLIFKPFVPHKDKCHHKISPARLPQSTNFHIPSVWPGVKTPGQRSKFFLNSSKFRNDNLRIKSRAASDFPLHSTPFCQFWHVFPGLEVKSQSYLYNNHRGRDSYVAGDLENRWAHPQLSYVNRKPKKGDGHRLIFIWIDLDLGSKPEVKYQFIQ